MTAPEVAALIVGAAAVIAALTVIWKVAKRGRDKATRIVGDGVKIRDSIIGREAMVDTITGQQLAPALPGIGQRMDTVERAVATLADQHRMLDDHEDRLKALEAASVERVVARAESAQAYRAMEAAINATPAEEPDTEL